MSGNTLTSDEVARYSRQLIMPEIGVQGQQKLKSTSVLIVGCGGLGCPAALYLTAAGFGRIGLVDADTVEKSNLHRQVLHREQRIGELKTQSAVDGLDGLNSNVNFEQFNTRLTRDNAIGIISKFDIILDATDNAMTRYLLSDACVVARKPLVSGAALRFEGQLTVYNYDHESPCYRCLFPSPPPPGTVTNCSDGGVIGVVPGIIGSLQALETIKIGAGIRPAFSGRMLLFDGLEGTFRNIKIRGKSDKCVSCGPNATITSDLIDYEAFCGTPTCSPPGEVFKILLPFERVSCKEFKEQVLDQKVPHVLIDVRSKNEAEINMLPDAVNIPLQEIMAGGGLKRLQVLLQERNAQELYVMCRRGNASQKAVRFIKDNLVHEKVAQDAKDLMGGIEGWSRDVDPTIPTY